MNIIILSSVGLDVFEPNLLWPVKGMKLKVFVYEDKFINLMFQSKQFVLELILI